jgi:hypothetical protein
MKIDFEFESNYGVYRDAIYLDDNHSLTEQDIEAMKLERFNNWVYAVENPPPSATEYIEIDGVQYEKVEIDGQVILKPVGV